MQQGAETEPSITHRARRNREFCLPPRLEPQDRAMPQRELQESTAQQKKTVLGTGDGLRGHARGREVLPKRLQTTPLTKPSRHMRKQLFFPPPSTPPRPFLHPGGSSWLIKAKSGELYPERQQEAHPDPSLWGSGKHSPTDWDRPAPPALVTARWAGPRISFCPVLKWQRGSHLFEVFQSINRQKPDSEFLP